MKKPSVVSFLITFLLAAAVCTHGNEFVELVTDEDGNPVEVGVKYFIQPQDSVGGGLAPSQDSNDVIETFEPNDLGRHVVFEFPYETPERFIPLDSAVTIEFKFLWPPLLPIFHTFWKVNVSSYGIVLVDTPMDENSSFKIENAVKMQYSDQLVVWIRRLYQITSGRCGADVEAGADVADLKRMMWQAQGRRGLTWS